MYNSEEFFSTLKIRRDSHLKRIQFLLYLPQTAYIFNISLIVYSQMNDKKYKQECIPVGCVPVGGPGSDLPQFLPWVWAWIWSPSISPLGVSLDLIPSISHLGVGLDLIPLNSPLGCGPGSDPPQFLPWVWAWIWSPSISPLGVGLDLIPLNFPLGCGPGSDPPQFPPWVWAWIWSPPFPTWVWAWIWSPSISPLGVDLDLIPLNFSHGCGPGSDPPQFPLWVWAGGGSVMAFCCGLLLCPSVIAFWFGGLLIEGGLLVEGSLLVESGLLLWPSGKAFWCGGHQTRRLPNQKPPLEQAPNQAPPQTRPPRPGTPPLETCCKVCWDTSCNACWDTHPLCEQNHTHL